jgi:hypothetical protein
MTAKQKANRERFKKVVAEAKKLRKKNPKLTQPQAVKQAWAIMYAKKKVGATKIIERGENKNAKVTKVLQRVRSKKGTFKGMKKVSGGTHKDTKSHNVNIRVVSGVDMYKIRDMIESEIKNNFKLLDIFKTYPFKNSIEKKSAIKKVKSNILLQKKQLREQNKLISQNLK